MLCVVNVITDYAVIIFNSDKRDTSFWFTFWVIISELLTTHWTVVIKLTFQYSYLI